MEFWLWLRWYPHDHDPPPPPPPSLTDVLSHPPALVDDFTEGSVGMSFSSTTVDQMECVTVTAVIVGLPSAS